MLGKACCFGWLIVLGVALVAGCNTQPTSGTHSATDEEGAVRAKFTELQEAVAKKDADKIWALMDSQSRAEAEKSAQAVQTAYAKASAEEKAEQEKNLGLTGTEVASLKGPGILKTKRFQHKYRELPESKIEKVTVQGDNATVHYLEPDGDKEKLIFVRQEGHWKAWLALPKLGGR
jgi:hypothetical protein